MIEKLLTQFAPPKNEAGGYAVPPERQKAARSAGLITLPGEVSGKNCGSCHHYRRENSTCNHQQLYGIHVNARQACDLWWHPGLIREGESSGKQ